MNVINYANRKFVFNSTLKKHTAFIHLIIKYSPAFITPFTIEKYQMKHKGTYL